MRAIYIVSAGTEWDNSPVLLLEPLGACHKTGPRKNPPRRCHPDNATGPLPHHAVAREASSVEVGPPKLLK